MNFNLETDLWDQAEFEKSNAPRPPTLLQGKGRASIFDPDPDEVDFLKEDSSLVKGYKVVSVRGRNIKLRHEDRPGIIDIERKTREALREVCPVGYSDELIKAYLRQEQRNSYDTPLEQGTSNQKTKVQKKLAQPAVLDEKLLYADATLDGPSFYLNDKEDFPELK